MGDILLYMINIITYIIHTEAAREYIPDNYYIIEMLTCY